jgi:hypothetical protein
VILTRDIFEEVLRLSCLVFPLPRRVLNRVAGTYRKRLVAPGYVGHRLHGLRANKRRKGRAIVVVGEEKVTHCDAPARHHQEYSKLPKYVTCRFGSPKLFQAYNLPLDQSMLFTVPKSPQSRIQKIELSRSSRHNLFPGRFTALAHLDPSNQIKLPSETLPPSPNQWATFHDMIMSRIHFPAYGPRRVVTTNSTASFSSSLFPTAGSASNIPALTRLPTYESKCFSSSPSW